MSGNVRSLEEDLQALGIGGGSESFFNDVKRRTGLLEDTQAPTKPSAQLTEEGDTLNEFRLVKRKRMSGAERLAQQRQNKLEYRKNKSASKMRAKKWAKSGAGKKARMRRAKLAAKMGGWSRLAKFRKQANKGGKRLSLSTGIDSISNLREHLEGTNEIKVSPYEEACVRASSVALDLAIVFDVLGESAVAEGLYALSDRCADLSEQFEDVFEPSDEAKAQLQAVIESVGKALDAHHDIGSPSVAEAFDFAEGVEIAE